MSQPLNGPDRTWPSVSVVLPVRDEAQAVVKAVQSALNQRYEGVLRVLVADGNSQDGTRQAVAELAGRDPRVRLVDNPAGTTPAGLNAAIRASQGEIIVRCDAHSILPPDYIQQAVDTLLATDADNVGGIQAAVGTTPTQRAIAASMTTPLGVGDSRFHYGGQPGPTDTVYLGVFRRSVFDRVGLFDDTVLRNQDYELNYRIRRAGGLVYFDPRLRVEYYPRRSLRALWDQYYQYGQGKRRVVRTHPSSIRWRHLAPLALLLGLTASAVVGFAWSGWVGLVIPGVYAAVLILASMTTAIRKRDPALLLMAPALATMHIAWGLGFLSALIAPRLTGP